MKTSDSRIEEPVVGTGTKMRLSALGLVYEKLAGAQHSFLKSAGEKANGLSCAAGCGECCRKFMPDILPVEAEAIALYLMSERPDLIARLDVPAQACPFIDDDNPEGLCAIYPVRPIVCRLFGFSGTTGKEGEPEFSLCGHMEPLKGVDSRRFRGTRQLEELFGSIPPVMGHFSTEISSIDPAGRRTSLLEAVPQALCKIGLGSALMNQSA